MHAHIDSYVHGDGRIGVLLCVLGDDDYTTRTDCFRVLVHDLALHIAAADPSCVDVDDIEPQRWEAEVERMQPALAGLSHAGRREALAAARSRFEARECLLLQPFVKDPQRSVAQIIDEASRELGSRIRVQRFVRFDADGA